MAFLARLADEGGRHRSSTTSVNRLPRSARLAAGLFTGILLALLVPLLLAFLG